MKKPLLIAAWFLVAPTAFATATLAAYKIHNKPPVVLDHQQGGEEGAQTAYAGDLITGQVKGLTTAVQTEDARPIIIAEFLATNDSPLKPYDYFGRFLTQIADKYNLDFRLLPSISMQESNLCKKIPDDSHNCLGLGIHSKGTWGFDSYEDNFETAAKILREKYLDQGLLTPDDIQNKYTPSSNGSWEFAVNHFMVVLENADF
ncbi:MAG: Mannosyl-glycoprotein endo-beta-N-acetylglucosaminidase [Microgenomates group bacterium GW2011_GWA1_Microgenomates_45_10]|nr:MAG: Mannosyl-glycoprotein endo-beta-N-acetylglucosaminidase [Microgenomates group bacterium GW2011_GWA1_Microgenomates_45_10]